MIEMSAVTKRFGSTTALDNVTFTVNAGTVTGFLGPNGAGKSTAMRSILGLEKLTAGHILVEGRPYKQLAAPMRSVGALLDATAVDGGRTAKSHLSALAATHRLGHGRVLEVLDLVGLTSVAKKRIRTFSLGMKQRLGIAAALLGDPATVILDEPVNGLDPDGVVWLRQLTRQLADEGRTVFLSSHLMTEMAQTADHLVILGRGRVLVDAPLSEILKTNRETVRVRSPQLERIAQLFLARPEVAIVQSSKEEIQIVGVSPTDVSTLAAAAGIPIVELSHVTRSLEDVYFTLTAGEAAYSAEKN